MSTNPLSQSQNPSVPSCPRVPPACTTAPELEKPLENALGQGEVLQGHGVCKNMSHLMFAPEQGSIPFFPEWSPGGNTAYLPQMIKQRT